MRSPHHFTVFGWRLSVLILHMHILLLHLLLVLLLHLHLHLHLLGGHLTPHMGMGSTRTPHGSHPIVGSTHFHLVGAHLHLHLLHTLMLHHLHLLLLLAHDTRGRHL